MGSISEIRLKRIEVSRVKHPKLSNPSLPSGVEIITIPILEDQNLKDEDHRIFLMEENESRIYLKISKKRETLKVEELNRIIKLVKGIFFEEISQDNQLKNWFYKQWKNENKWTDVEPSWVNNIKNWSQGWIPLIFLKRNNKNWTDEILELLNSYFNAEFFEVIISPSIMFLIVSNRDLELVQKKDLEEFALGLYEMLQSEWTEEIKVGIHFSANSINALVSNGFDLLQDEKWVNKLWNDITLFTPWHHQLERLIFKIPRTDIDRLTSNRWEIDENIIKTLVVFFDEDLNMSETARRLFIHRNTLQYRIDKFKQQTGLDVKKFEDAILAKVIFILNRNSEQIAQ